MFGARLARQEYNAVLGRHNRPAKEDPLLYVGPCLTGPADVDRLVEESGVDAIMCVQSTEDFSLLGIDISEIRDRAKSLGVWHSYVPVVDMDVSDQATMLPQMARQLALHLSLDQRTYLHCTAGVNRSPLAALGYLSLVRCVRLPLAPSPLAERLCENDAACIAACGTRKPRGCT